MNKKPLFTLLIVCMASVGPAFAQLTPEGRINGKVVDTQGNHLGVIAIETGRTIKWDPATETLVGDPAAERLLGRAYRRPYQLPV